jgi:hypothetical protein
MGRILRNVRFITPIGRIGGNSIVFSREYADFSPICSPGQDIRKISHYK